jgi:CheY-like chemotaxis protein
VKIVIVDDNERIRKLIARLLEKLNIPLKVIECENGEEAVNIYSEEKPDLVLMDIVMDRMDGLKATQRIVKADKDAKIIIVSQLPEDEYKKEAINAGAIEFVNKENLSMLIQVVYKLQKDNIADNLN